MYLKDGREIYESDKYPGYYIDADTGSFCDENGYYIGGNQDDGDRPGNHAKVYDNTRTVWVTKSGSQYYPKRTKSATIAMTLYKARSKGYRASVGYQKFIEKELKKQSKKK